MNPRYMTLGEIEKELGYSVKIIKEREVSFGAVPVGGVFHINGKLFVKLHNVFAITKDIISYSIFGTEISNYKDSSIIHSDILHSFLKELSKFDIFHMLDTFTVDLTSDNGIEEYGTERDTIISLLTLAQFQQNAKILLEHNTSAWWLSTPHGTVQTGVPNRACYISKMGMLEHGGIKETLGVRPIIKIKDNIQVVYYDMA